MSLRKLPLSIYHYHRGLWLCLRLCHRYWCGVLPQPHLEENLGCTDSDRTLLGRRVLRAGDLGSAWLVCNPLGHSRGRGGTHHRFQWFDVHPATFGVPAAGWYRDDCGAQYRQRYATRGDDANDGGPNRRRAI